MADPIDEQPAQGDEERRTDEPRPVFDFKLRLGTRESTAALADHATGELVQLQPIEWEPLVGVRSDDDERSYQTDSDLQSIIVELANKIATPEPGAPSSKADAGPSVAPRPQPPAAPVPPSTPSVTLRPMFQPDNLVDSLVRPEPVTPEPARVEPAPVDDTVAEPVTVEPVAVEHVVPVPVVAPAVVTTPVIAWSPAPEPAVTAEPAPAPAAPVPAAVATELPIEQPAPAEPEVAAAVASPEPEVATAWSEAVGNVDLEHARIYGLGDSHQHSTVEAPAQPTTAAAAASAPVHHVSSGPVAMTPVTPIPPMGGAPTGSVPLTPPPMPPRPSSPGIGAPLQLAKAERRTDAPRTTKPVDFRDLLGEQGLNPSAVRKRKQKRHPFRVLFKLIVVLAIIGAGLFFGKKYVLDMRWASEIKPYAEAIAEHRGLDWDRAVKVETLPMSDYALRLASTELGLDVAGVEAASVEWRAMGLIGPGSQTDLTQIGAAAVSRRPAFYDPSTKKVYVVADAVGQLRELALNRALTLALLDQHFHWTSAAASSDPGVRLAIETMVDGDATSLAASLVDPSIATNPVFLEQQAALASRAGVFVHSAPRYAVDLVAGSDAATSRFAPLAVPADRDALLQAWPASDAGVFDGVRDLATLPIQISAGASRGMMYWYYVLAGVLPEVDAWNAALTWRGDEVTVTPDGCVSSFLSPADEAGRQQLLDALGRWQAGLARTDIVIAPEGTERIRVDACDPVRVPGLDMSTMPVPSDAVVPFGRSSSELSAVAQVHAVDPTVQQCIVNAVRAFDVVPLIRQGESADRDQVLADINASCTAPAAPATTVAGG